LIAVNIVFDIIFWSVSLMSLVKNIKKLADTQGISLRELGIKLGIGENAIYKWEKSSPKVETLQKVADYFNVTIDSLIAKTFYIEDIKDADGKIKESSFNPSGDPYILLSEKARKNGISPEVLETLIDAMYKHKKITN
jgi:transcriptional regulator with XRE-family HTH domain